VDLVCVLASNDAFVMSAWGKVNGITDEIVSLFLSAHRRLPFSWLELVGLLVMHLASFAVSMSN